MTLKTLGDLWWKFHGFGGLSASTLSLSQINKLCWACHFELNHSEECGIMGKTTDWYSEVESRGGQKVLSQSLVAKQAFL